jgi:hypothetical protein
MKRFLFVLLLALIQPVDASQYWQSGAYMRDDTGTVKGVRSTIEVVKVAGKSQKSAWTAAWIGDRWVQAGYINWSGPKIVVMCFSLVNGAWKQGCPGTDYYAHTAIVQNSPSVFEITNLNDSNTWRVTIDGVLTSEFDMGANSAKSAQVNIEQSPADRPEHFPTVEFKPALELLVSGVWRAATYAQSSYNDWGVEGTRQNSALGNNQLRMGSAIKILPRDTLLWDIR